MAPVSPNGWISVDLGWIWVGYIQDGPLGPFGPIGIAPGGLHGGQKWPKNAIKRAFMAKSGPNRPSWMYPTQIQPISTEIQPFGATGATYGHKWAFYGIFGQFVAIK